MAQILNIRENVLLAPFTTLGIGGPSRYFVDVNSGDELVEALDFAERYKLSVFILGRGSNLLVSDDGFDGIVIRVTPKGIEIVESLNAKVIVEASSGENWDDLVKYCVDNDLAGIECLSGIPGLVGGTPVQNVGAYGQEVSDTIVDVRCYDRHQKRFCSLSNDECGFNYRSSVFSTSSSERYIVLSVRFALEKNGDPKIVYKDLIECFDGKKPTLAETREAVLAIRRSKSMVIDLNDPDSRSAGSFFKNPVVEKERYEQMTAKLGLIPSFEFQGRVKIPAAWLIERSGISKGYSIGPAAVSRNHTLALVNRGNARAADILALKEVIQNAVLEKYGILLEPEPQFIGFNKN